jgi:hypothetical protein
VLTALLCLTRIVLRKVVSFHKLNENVEHLDVELLDAICIPACGCADMNGAVAREQGVDSPCEANYRDPQILCAP